MTDQIQLEKYCAFYKANQRPPVCGLEIGEEVLSDWRMSILLVSLTLVN